MNIVELDLDYSNNIFYLKIQNKSKEPIRLWRQEYSLGYYSIYFIQSFFEKKEVVCFIKRKLVFWTMNPPTFYSIQPLNFQTFKFDLNDGSWDLTEFNKIDSHVEFELKCILAITPDEDTLKYNILTGIYQSNSLQFDSISQIINMNR